MTQSTKVTPAGTPTDAFYDGLRKLRDDCGKNKHDRALMLIAACIGEGFSKAPWIVAVLRPLGLDPRHVGMILSGQILAGQAATLWQRDNEGKFIALEAA